MGSVGRVEVTSSQNLSVSKGDVVHAERRPRTLDWSSNRDVVPDFRLVARFYGPNVVRA